MSVTARLEDLAAGVVAGGLVPGETVTVVAARWAGSRSLVVTYRTSAGRVDEQVVYRDQEGSIDVVTAGRAWSFDGDPGLFRLVAEVRRINAGGGLGAQHRPIPADVVLSRGQTRVSATSFSSEEATVGSGHHCS